MGKVVLYMTSTPTTLKLKHDIKRVQELLAAKGIQHEEVKDKKSALLHATVSLLALRQWLLFRLTSQMSRREGPT